MSGMLKFSLLFSSIYLFSLFFVCVFRSGDAFLIIPIIALMMREHAGWRFDGLV